jgi:hypothetical protein
VVQRELLGGEDAGAVDAPVPIAGEDPLPRGEVGRVRHTLSLEEETISPPPPYGRPRGSDPWEVMMAIVFDAIGFLLYFVAFWAFVCSPCAWRRGWEKLRREGMFDRFVLVVESAVCAFCGLAPVAAVAALLA